MSARWISFKLVANRASLLIRAESAEGAAVTLHTVHEEFGRVPTDNSMLALSSQLRCMSSSVAFDVFFCFSTTCDCELHIAGPYDDTGIWTLLFHLPLPLFFPLSFFLPIQHHSSSNVTTGIFAPLYSSTASVNDFGDDDGYEGQWAFVLQASNLEKLA